MKHVSLQVIAHSPLAIRSDHAEGGASTAHDIPGATLLGSLAAAHRILRPEQEGEFISFFLKEQVYFPYLYPALFKDQDMLTSGLPILPLPKTAQSCKRFPGFLPLSDEDFDEEQHGIRDTLLDWAVFSLLDLEREQHDVPALLAPLEQHELCIQKQCKQAMDHTSGYYRRDRFNPEQRAKAQVHTRLQTRTGINRNWGVVEDGILYNREVFDEGMHFWGEVILPDELADSFVAFVKKANNENVIRVGTGRTRGLGRIEVDARPTSREDFAHFTERLSNFNATLKRRAKDVHVENLDTFYFALTLYTPTILCDPFLRYYNTIDDNTLGKLLGYSTSTFTRIYQSVGMQVITGWNELWGTPRTNDYAMEIGSTFLFACTHKPYTDDKDLLQALYNLEETGIGRRRTEGFGRIRISDPFHLEGEQS